MSDVGSNVGNNVGNKVRIIAQDRNVRILAEGGNIIIEVADGVDRLGSIRWKESGLADRSALRLLVNEVERLSAEYNRRQNSPTHGHGSGKCYA